jgi:hypothetical protein
MKATSALQIGGGCIMVGASSAAHPAADGLTFNLGKHMRIHYLALFWNQFIALALIVGPLAAYYMTAQGFFFGGRGGTPSVNLPRPTAYWGFESNAVDHTGTNNFTTNGATLQFSAGVRGRAAMLGQSVGSWLSSNSTNLQSAYQSWALVCWVKVPADAGGSFLIGKGYNSGEYAIEIQSSETFGAKAEIGGTIKDTTLSTGGDITGAWQLLVLQFTSSGGPLRVIDLKSPLLPNETTFNFAISAATPGTNLFQISRSPDTALLTTMEIDEVAFFQGLILSREDIATLYNGGLGRTWTNSLGWR